MLNTQLLHDLVCIIFSGYLKQHHSDLFVPQLPESKVKVINTLKMGVADKMFLKFEEPFWDLEYPGIQLLWSGDEINGQDIDETNWFRSIIGFDIVQNQPNMLIGWISGLPAKYFISIIFNIFWCAPFGYPYFLLFSNEPKLGAGIDPSMALTLFPSIILDETIFEPTTYRSGVAKVRPAGHMQPSNLFLWPLDLF